MADGFLGLGKRADRVVIVSRDEWELMQVDVRGLKRLADLEAQERREQNARFASAIDTLEQRINELGSLLASVAASHERATTEFVNRLQRAESAIGDAKDARATDIAVAFDRIDELEKREHGASGAQIAAIETELAAVRGELSGRLDTQTQAIGEAHRRLDALVLSLEAAYEKLEGKQDRATYLGPPFEVTSQALPSLADIASLAPAPDVQKMREFYEARKAKQAERYGIQGETRIVSDDESNVLLERDGQLNVAPFGEAGGEQPSASLTPERAPIIVVTDEPLPEDQQKIIDKLEAALTPPVLEAEAQERASQESL